MRLQIILSVHQRVLETNALGEHLKYLQVTMKSYFWPKVVIYKQLQIRTLVNMNIHHHHFIN